MAIKTITLAGAELAVTGLDGSNAAVRNDSADVLYVGTKPGITPGADGVMSVPAGQPAVVYGISGAIYALGTGQATVVSSDHNDNPFKSSVTYGSVADIVAGAVSNRNLLDNPNFRVNQRGASGTITAAGYFVDRWKLDSGEVTVNSDGTLTLNGTISQTLENAVGVTVTASSGAGTASYDDSTKTFTLTASGEVVSWAKLEVGKISTPFVPPHPAEELAKCQRYFNTLFVNGIPVQFVGNGIAVSDSIATVLVNLPVAMRLPTPTVSLTGTLYLSDGNHTAANSIAVQGIAGSYLNRNVLQLNLTSDGVTLDRSAAYLLSRRDTDTVLTVSADL